MGVIVFSLSCIFGAFLIFSTNGTLKRISGVALLIIAVAVGVFRGGYVALPAAIVSIAAAQSLLRMKAPFEWSSSSRRFPRTVVTGVFAYGAIQILNANSWTSPLASMIPSTGVLVSLGALAAGVILLRAATRQSAGPFMEETWLGLDEDTDEISDKVL